MGKLSGKPGPDPGHGGAPRKPIDLDLVRRLAGIGCTIEELAVACAVAVETMYHRMELEPALGVAYQEGSALGKTTLRRLQWQKAQTGDSTMLIWLGKQMLGQRDKADVDATVSGNPNAPIVVKYEWSNAVTIESDTIRNSDERLPPLLQ
jgi:hypothetical protein